MYWFRNNDRSDTASELDQRWNSRWSLTFRRVDFRICPDTFAWKVGLNYFTALVTFVFKWENVKGKWGVCSWSQPRLELSACRSDGTPTDVQHSDTWSSTVRSSTGSCYRKCVPRTFSLWEAGGVPTEVCDWDLPPVAGAGPGWGTPLLPRGKSEHVLVTSLSAEKPSLNNEELLINL